MYCTAHSSAFNEIIHFVQCLITPIWGAPREHIYRKMRFNVVMKVNLRSRKRGINAPEFRSSDLNRLLVII